MADQEVDLTGLPEEVVEAIKGPQQLSADRLTALGQTLSKRRAEAVQARRESGIEDVWTAAEEAYLGIDDANRSEFGKAKWAKPVSLTGPVTTDATRQTGEVKSTAFVRLTSRYVDAGTAKLGEILLPVDDKAFSFDATPLPEMVKGTKDTTQVVDPKLGPLERNARPGELTGQPGAAQSSPGGPAVALPAAAASTAPGSSVPPGVPLTVADLAEEAIQLAQQSAKKAEKRIYDWMVESQYPAEMRKVIFDGARIGVGVLKAPFPDKRVRRAASKVNGKVAVELKVEIKPSYQWRDPWNIFPDAACGENIQNGDYLFDRDFYSNKQLLRLKNQPGYINTAIDKVLAEGPNKETVEPGNPNHHSDKHQRYAIWFYYGTVSREDLLATGTIKPEEEKDKQQFYAICTLVNDTVIRAIINPLESGEFPYHAVPWQRRAGHWAGVGIGEQVSLPQRMINAATRTMLNNAGKSAGSITVLDRGSIVPADGSWVLGPDKLYYKAADATIDDVRKAFAFFQIPNMTPQLMAIVEYALRLAEESTSIPLITQGQSGKTTPETFGATQLQNNNANQLLRSIGYAWDDYITEPVVRQSYEMLLLDDTVPDNEKGDWAINAHGSTAFVERAIQDQTIQAMAGFVKDPAYGTNPKKWFAEFMRTKHLNPTVFQYTKEEQAKIDAQPPPKAPAVEVALIRSQDTEKKIEAEKQIAATAAGAVEHSQQIAGEARIQVAEIKKGTDERRIQADTDRDTIYVQSENARTAAEDAARREELALRERLAILDYANKKDLKIEDVKKQLADTAMRLNVQRELAGAAHVVDTHNAAADRSVELHNANADRAVELHTHHTAPGPVIKPAAEPLGKAPDGEAFTK